MPGFSQRSCSNQGMSFRIRPSTHTTGRQGPAKHVPATPSTPPPTGPELPATPRCFYSPRQASSSPSLLPSCRLLRSEAYSDLAITLDGSSDLKVHRAMLAVHSPFFERLLSDTWRTDSVQLRPGVVDLLEERKSVEWLAHHLYCGLRHLEDWREAIDVLHLAHMCLLPSATSLATEMLKHNVNNETFSLVFNAAALTSNDDLLKACEKHLRKHTDQLLASEQLLSIARVSLHRLLQSPALQPSSELLLFTFIVNWGNHRLSEDGELYSNRTTSSSNTPSSSTTTNNNSVSTTQSLPPPPESQPNLSLRSEIAEFLPQIRFLAMNPTEIVEYVLEYNVLSNQEGISLLRNLWDVPGVHLPTLVSCKSRSPRRSEKEDPRRAERMR